MPKKTSSKHQPKGLEILHEDQDILVVNKSSGLLTVSTESIKGNTAHFLLNEYVKKGNPRSKNRVFIVHRLDRETSGILVFAKNEKAKSFLQTQWKEFDKTYLAVVHGRLPEKESIISSYLLENKAYRMYSTDDSTKGKLSKTGYKVVKELRNYTLLEVKLYTGRKNQIRVHLADIGHPVVGDKIYGKKEKGVQRLALHAASLTISHPYTKEKITFESDLPAYLKMLVQS